MFYPESFKVTTPSDLEIVVVRDFDAPRGLVFDAFTKPELVRQWLLGPPGWTMPVCDIDLRVGGTYRYVWRKEGVKDMGMGGVFRVVEAPCRLVATEKFDDSWYPGEALDTTVFVEEQGRTKITITVLYESKEARDVASRSGMEQGMAAGYNRLEELLPGLAGRAQIEMPRIVETAAQWAAALHLVIPRSEMRAVMGPGIGEVKGAVKSQGAAPTGAWFTHHLKMDPEIFDFEICVPIAAPIAGAGRVVCLEVPGRRVARTVLHGGYERLGEAWGEFGKWIEGNGHTAGPDLYECYLKGPESSGNPEDWRTELSRPLMD